MRETVATAREREKPYAVVLNAAPVKRDEKESPVVTQARAHLDGLGIPVWAGQISHRAGYALTLAAGASATEAEPQSSAASEIARLWTAIERSVDAVNAAPQARTVAGGAGASRQPRDGNPRRLKSQRPSMSGEQRPPIAARLRRARRRGAITAP